jgi:large subunit ribosomal protein L17
MVSLARELFLHGKIVTTDAKARELRPYAEKLITTAKEGGVSASRKLAGKMQNNPIVGKLVNMVAPKYKERTGGYIRITKMERRLSDGSKMATIELI